MKIHYFVVSVLLVGLALRLYQFGQIPFGVNRDEAALGYNAFTILKTGMDEHQRYMPLQFESFGDWKKPVYIYLSTIPIFLFGLTEPSIRILSLIAGAVLSLFLYLLLQQKYASHPHLKYAPIMAVIIVAFNPWHFFFSRIAVEAMVAVSFFVAGLYFWEKQKPLIGTTLFVVSVFTYHAALIIIPLWMVAYLFLDKTKHKNFNVLTALLILTLVLIGQFHASFLSPEAVKAKGLVIFDFSLAQQQAIMAKRTKPWSRFIHNRYVYVFQSLSKNYLQTFTPKFLIKQGGINPSYNVLGFGNFTEIEIIFAAIGLLYLVRTKVPFRNQIIAWLLIAPLPGALTYEAVHSTREIFLMPIIIIIAAIGTSWVISHTNPKPTPAFVGIIALTVISSASFYYHYFYTYPAQSDKIYHGYLKNVVNDAQINSKSGEYEHVVIEFFRESPYIFYAFYNQLEPSTFHQTVEYYPTDFEGFTHVKTLDGIVYEGRDEEDIALDLLPQHNNLVYSNPNDLEPWIKTIQIWDNLEGESEVASWQEKQI